MHRAYCITEGDNVLLVGEGNFTFSKDFVNLNEKAFVNKLDKTKVTSTCKEPYSENISEFKQETIKYLQNKGVTVFFNVDATNLKGHPTIKTQKFDKVIFNFPHVGGKMKIHLNRKLLKDFFSSACDVLKDNGSVVVALCDGQGGTGADKKQRRWDDTWQVTEMAAHSDLILYHFEPFDVSCFPHYVNVGFRSCDKSFHAESSVVHIFKKHNPPRILQQDPYKWCSIENLSEDAIFDFLDNVLVNPFLNQQSASSFICTRLCEKLGSSFHVYKSFLKYDASPDLNKESKFDLLSEPVEHSLFDLMNVFTAVKEDCMSSGKIIVRVLRRSRPVVLHDFGIAPMRCQIIIFGAEISSSLFGEYLTQMLLLFDSECNLNTVVVNEELCKVSLSSPINDLVIVESLILPNMVPCHIIHVDDLAQILFKVDDWKTLWCSVVQTSISGHPTIHPSSLFPKPFSFDLSLSVPLHLKEEFEKKFLLMLWLLAGDLIIKSEHLSTYLPSDRELICYCYRITYKSHNAALYRKRVIHIHENIIAKFVCKYLQIDNN